MLNVLLTGSRSIVQKQNPALGNWVVPWPLAQTGEVRGPKTHRPQRHHRTGILLVDQSLVSKSVNTVRDPRKIRRKF